MFVKYISLLPEFLLLLNVLVMQIIHLIRQSQTPKTFSTISKFFIGGSLVSCIIFYNRSIDVNWYTNSNYTTFFKGIILLSAWLSNLLACKWFLTKNQLSIRYYQTISLSLLGLCGAISCCNLLALYLFLFFYFIISIPLIFLSYDYENKKQALKSYIINGLLLVLFLSIGVGGLYFQYGNLSYSALQGYFQKLPLNAISYISVGFIFSALLGILGAAPFQMFLDKIVRFSILPVSTYFLIIPIWAGFAILLILSYNVFNGINIYLHKFMLICGVISIILGSIGSNSTKNIRQIFANVNMFNIGILLVLFSYVNQMGLQSGIIYLLIYMFSIFGIYICFYGMRSHGEYLQELSDLSGMYEVKPYISSALLIFIVSLLGVPPLLGMLGNISLVNSLLSTKSYSLIFFIFVMLSWLAYGLLGVIKSIYFDKRINRFDRADKGVYIGLLVNILIVLLVTFQPRYLISNLQDITDLLLKQVF